MSKLRNAAPGSSSPAARRNVSRTMEIAQDVSVAICQPTFKTNGYPLKPMQQRSPQPVSLPSGLAVYQSNEARYWAERAQVAEAQLQLIRSATVGHNVTVRSASASYNSVGQDQERLARLEWLVVCLSHSIVSLPRVDGKIGNTNSKMILLGNQMNDIVGLEQNDERFCQRPQGMGYEPWRLEEDSRCCRVIDAKPHRQSAFPRKEFCEDEPPRKSVIKKPEPEREDEPGREKQRREVMHDANTRAE
ncbi:hypothetical protein H0H87_000802 [Tephrocybe sp. NHM501043]|nr:hypothetical protein H0H87_000802 [Tephrocybe sp. NHM501043]